MRMGLCVFLLLSLETFISEGKVQELEECRMALFKDAKSMRAEITGLIGGCCKLLEECLASSRDSLHLFIERVHK